MSVKLTDAKRLLSMTVDAMKIELKGISQTVKGKKLDLQLRLLDAWAAGSSSSSSSSKRKQSSTANDSIKRAKGGSLRSFLTEPSWVRALEGPMSAPYFTEVESFVSQERKSGKEVYPVDEDVFAAFNATPFSKVKVVIIGQDPYFNPGQGHGLCFSVQKGVKVPPSLNRIYKELENNLPGWSRPSPQHGYLMEWAKQGVLLLNATLTVQKGKANSHAKCGWQKFTDDVIKIINDKCEGVVFFLWGGFAQKKGKMLDSQRHLVLKCAHPSPMSGMAWYDNHHFSEANKYLKSKDKSTIDWTVPS